METIERFPERSVRRCREIAFPSFPTDRSIVCAGGCVPRGPCTIKALTISGLDHPVAAPQLHRSKLRIGGHKEGSARKIKRKEKALHHQRGCLLLFNDPLNQCVHDCEQSNFKDFSSRKEELAFAANASYNCIERTFVGGELISHITFGQR
ncbi:hypothetical protein V1477_007673 [Vespula maculifrons]|uniref:Uncharacterized protein n=1 Tax=Vespula maculifrons TaxID=7453 RepID=A0ABD2CJ10_VESMC